MARRRSAVERELVSQFLAGDVRGNGPSNVSNGDFTTPLAVAPRADLYGVIRDLPAAPRLQQVLHVPRQDSRGGLPPQGRDGPSVEELQSALASSRAEAHSVREELRSLRVRSHQLAADNRALRDALGGGSKKEVSVSRARESDLIAELAELRRQMEAHKADALHWEAQCRRLEHTSRNGQPFGDAALNDVHEEFLQTAAKDRDALIRELRSQLTAAENGRGGRGHITILENTVAALLARLDGSQTTDGDSPMSRADRRRLREARDKADHAERAIVDMHGRLDVQAAEQQQLVDTLETMKADMDKERETYDERILCLERELVLKEDIIRSLRSTQGETMHLRATAVEQTRSMSDLQQLLDNEILVRKQREAEADQLRQRVADVTKELEQKEEEMVTMAKSEAASLEVAKQVDAIKAENANFLELISTQDKKLQGNAAEIATMKKEADEMAQCIVKLEAALDEADTDLDASNKIRFLMDETEAKLRRGLAQLRVALLRQRLLAATTLCDLGVESMAGRAKTLEGQLETERANASKAATLRDLRTEKEFQTELDRVTRELRKENSAHEEAYEDDRDAYRKAVDMLAARVLRRGASDSAEDGGIAGVALESMYAPPHYVALWDYQSRCEEDTTVARGTIVEGLGLPEKGWLRVRFNDSEYFIPLPCLVELSGLRKTALAACPQLPPLLPFMHPNAVSAVATDTQAPPVPPSESVVVYCDDPCDDSNIVTICKAVSLDMLVHRISHPRSDKPEMTRTVLTTLPNFVSPDDFMRLLDARFFSRAPPHRAAFFYASLQQPMQLKVLALIKQWVTDFPADFNPDGGWPELHSLCLAMLTRAANSPHAAVQDEAGTVLRLLTHSVAERKGPLSSYAHIKVNASFPSSIILATAITNLDQTQVHPLELARQLTLIDFAEFRAINPREFLKQAWNKEGKETRARHLIACIERVNLTTKWAVTEILNKPTTEERAATFCFLIDVAHNLLALHNYASFMAILAALQITPISRMKYMMERVPPEYESGLAELVDLMSMTHNYRKYREAIKKMEPPVLPYVGLHLQDLTFMDDGNPSKIDAKLGDGKLINIEKEQMTAEAIAALEGMRAETPKLYPVGFIQDYLKNFKGLSESDQYKMSLKLEPRDMKPPAKKDRKPIAYEPISGNLRYEFELDGSFLDTLVERMVPKKLQKDQYVFEKGSTDREMYFIAQGMVLIELPDRTINLNQGMFFGEMALFLDKPRSASVKAATEVELLVLSKKVCDDVLLMYPNMKQRFEKLATERVEENARGVASKPAPSFFNKLADKVKM